MATVSNLYVDQGSYFSTFINITGSNGSPFDLTDYTVSAQMRKNAGSSISYNIYCQIVDPEVGKIKIRFDSESTENIPHGRYQYDVEIRDSTGEKLRVLEGLVVINPQMTKVIEEDIPEEDETP